MPGTASTCRTWPRSFLLLAAVGLGGGGLAVAASIVSRRGRDALLSVYILMLVLVLSPLLARARPAGPSRRMAGLVQPLFSMNRLVWDDETAPALATSLVWLVMGLAGTAVAAWRLRPTCLATGETVKKSRRRAWVPPLGDRPMLWKELYIERVGTSRPVRPLAGRAVHGLIGGGSLVLAGIILVDLFWRTQTTGRGGRPISWRSGSPVPAAMFMGWLLQWAVGLRAAVSIASERERGTWDALLMSPLEPGEIVRAKLFGQPARPALDGRRDGPGLDAGTVVGAVGRGAYITWIAANAWPAALMAAIGVRCSLSLPTATKAMTWTIALWMASVAVVAFLAFSIIAMVCLFFITVWMVAVQYGFVIAQLRPVVSHAVGARPGRSRPTWSCSC